MAIWHDSLLPLEIIPAFVVKSETKVIDWDLFNICFVGLSDENVVLVNFVFNSISLHLSCVPF